MVSRVGQLPRSPGNSRLKSRLTSSPNSVKLRFVNDSASELSTHRSNLEDEIEACAGLLPVLARAMNCAIAELSQALAVPPGQVKALLQLSRKEQMSVGEIADALHVSMPAASEIVDRLVDTGHVFRTADPADRRRVIVSASSESRHVMDQLVELRRSQVRRALLRLAPEERPVATRALEALIAELASSDELRATLNQKSSRPA